MNTERHQIVVSGVTVDVVRKEIKNLHLGVYPPDGRVRVAAPMILSDEAVRLAVIARLGWIKRQRAKFEAQERQSEREYVSGECHFFKGRRYRLHVIENSGRPRVSVRGSVFLDLVVKPGADRTVRESLLQRWYRNELKASAAPLLDKWAQRMSLPVPDLGIKRMKTKWGTCSHKWPRLAEPRTRQEAAGASNTSSSTNSCISWNATTTMHLWLMWTGFSPAGALFVMN